MIASVLFASAIMMATPVAGTTQPVSDESVQEALVEMCQSIASAMKGTAEGRDAGIPMSQAMYIAKGTGAIDEMSPYVDVTEHILNVYTDQVVSQFEI